MLLCLSSLAPLSLSPLSDGSHRSMQLGKRKTFGRSSTVVMPTNSSIHHTCNLNQSFSTRLRNLTFVQIL